MVAHCFNGQFFEAEDCDILKEVSEATPSTRTYRLPALWVTILNISLCSWSTLKISRIILSIPTKIEPISHTHYTYPLYIPIIPYSLFPAIFTKYIHFTSQTSVLSKYYLRNSSSFKLKVNMVLHSLSLPLNFSSIQKTAHLSANFPRMTPAHNCNQRRYANTISKSSQYD